MEDITGYQIKVLPRKYSRGRNRMRNIAELGAREKLILAASAICTQREISTVMGISQQSVSKIINKLRGLSKI